MEATVQQREVRVAHDLQRPQQPARAPTALVVIGNNHGVAGKAKRAEYFCKLLRTRQHAHGRRLRSNDLVVGQMHRARDMCLGVHLRSAEVHDQQVVGVESLLELGRFQEKRNGCAHGRVSVA
jgi:hypothetical protein